MTPFFLLAALLGATAHAAPPPVLACTAVYGGEVQSFAVPPSTAPYRVEAFKIGKRFEFKAVYVAAPAERAAVNLYVYYPTEDGPVLLHQAKYLPPYPKEDASSSYGFTGLHFVYEPTRASEFQFWCGWKP